jgi:hypothetical protein
MSPNLQECKLYTHIHIQRGRERERKREGEREREKICSYRYLLTVD